MRALRQGAEDFTVDVDRAGHHTIIAVHARLTHIRVAIPRCAARDQSVKWVQGIAAPIKICATVIAMTPAAAAYRPEEACRVRMSHKDPESAINPASAATAW